MHEIQANDHEENALSSPRTPPAALYIHWPFCKKKCPYCDFNSHVREGVDHAAWRVALLREMGYWHARVPAQRIGSIFFGGGTPSLMEPSTVAALIEEADRLWGLDADCEITLEANPTSVEAAKFTALAAAGVNRVSLGVQSLRPESLKFLGREHSADEALAAVALAAQTFDRYSFDLIYALPGQTLAAWEAELRAALTHARGHLSLYQLTIEENTAFHHAYHVGKSFQLPEESLAAELYQLTQVIMAEAGLPAYEISNHAVPGQESRHNLAYWRSDSYIGIGPGAHGRVDVREGVSSLQSPVSREERGPPPSPRDSRRMTSSLLETGDWRLETPSLSRLATRTLKSPERWLDAVAHHGHGLEEELTLTIAERAEEAVLMGLRLQAGVALQRLDADTAAYLQQLWADGRVEALVAHGLLIATADTLRTTERGKLLLNRVIEALLQ